MKKYIKTTLIICAIMLVACSETKNPSEPEEIKVIDAFFKEEPNVFFNLDKKSYWELKNAKGEVASFQALSKDSISIAMRFWDTINYNRKQVFATPIEFVYRESGLRQRRYFALIEEQDSVIFATRNYRMLANYTLNFYVYLFKIPKTKLANGSFMETDSTILPVGVTDWERTYLAEWTSSNSVLINSQNHNVWQVEYNATDSYHVPPVYTNEFSFIEDIGFYSYMGYTLVP